MAKLVNLVENSLVTENVGGSGSCGEGMLGGEWANTALPCLKPCGETAIHNKLGGSRQMLPVSADTLRQHCSAEHSRNLSA